MAPPPGKKWEPVGSKEKKWEKVGSKEEREKKEKEPKGKSKRWEAASPDEWAPQGAKGWKKPAGKGHRKGWAAEPSAWEAQVPVWESKTPAWDICWDFSKYGAKKPAAWEGKTPAKGGSKWSKWAEEAWQLNQWGVPWQPQQYATSGNPFAGINAQMGMGADAYGLPPFLEAKHREWSGQKQAMTDFSTANKPPPPPPPPPPPEGKMFEGSLKSLSRRNGYGFISCAESYQMYGRDVYLPKETVPEDAKVLDRLSFTLMLSTKGHPQAEAASIVNL